MHHQWSLKLAREWSLKTSTMLQEEVWVAAFIRTKKKNSSGDSKCCCPTADVGIRPFGTYSAPFVVEQQLKLCYKMHFLLLASQIWRRCSIFRLLCLLPSLDSWIVEDTHVRSQADSQAINPRGGAHPYGVWALSRNIYNKEECP